MSNGWAGVRGWAGVGACSADGGVGWLEPGRRAPRTSWGHATIGGYVESSRKPVKQHICCFYWLTRGGAAAVGERAGGGVLGSQRVPARPGFDCIYTNVCRPGGCRSVSTQSFRAAWVKSVPRSLNG